MDNRAYWIWMQQAFGAGSPLPWRIHRSVPGGVEAFYQGGPPAVEFPGGHPGAGGPQPCSLFPWRRPRPSWSNALKRGLGGAHPGVWGVSPGAGRIFTTRPRVQYGKGKLPDMDSRPALAVVGARKATPETQEKAREFGYQLALGGASVVTGGAVGVDAAVALGAMSGGGPVVSVLPVALNSPYLSKKPLFAAEHPGEGRRFADGILRPADAGLWHVPSAQPADNRPGLRGAAAPGRPEKRHGDVRFLRQGPEPGRVRLARPPGGPRLCRRLGLAGGRRQGRRARGRKSWRSSSTALPAGGKSSRCRRPGRGGQRRRPPSRFWRTPASRRCPRPRRQCWQP